MPSNEGRPAATNSQASKLTRIPTLIVPRLTPEAKCFLHGLGEACFETAETKEPRVVKIGLALISQAPVELPRLLGGRV